jgi:murein DD-endopeptidase MepM/ murein hydrolase activator NlpD
LAHLQTRTATLRRLLLQRQRDARRLQQLITQLATRTLPPPTRLSPRLRTPPIPQAMVQPAPPPPSLSALVFRWPSASRRLLRGYGLQRSPETNTSWDNPGIDIAAPRGSTVTAAAAGVVRLIQWIPTYQYVVVLEHADNFRSVYGNLESVSVAVGTTISAGTPLGTVGETPDGAGFHFQLWRGRQRLNPLEWLR